MAKRKRVRKRKLPRLERPVPDPVYPQGELAYHIYRRVRKLGLTQAQAARLLELKQPHISKLMNGRHSGFSIERLFRFLMALDQDIEISISPKPETARRQARVKVVGG